MVKAVQEITRTMSHNINDSAHDRGSHTVWTPPPELVHSSALSRFIAMLEPITGKRFSSYQEFHGWSVTDPESFWRQAIQFLEIQGEGEISPALAHLPGPTPLSRQWFPKFSLNFADNLLSGPADRPAITAWSEDRLIRRCTLGELRDRVASVSEYLTQIGISAGDRVFGYLPNIPEAITCMLGAAKVGATWSSCGTDYQAEGVIARIERVKPKVLVAASSYMWRGEVRTLTPSIEAIVRRSDSIEVVILVDYLGENSAAPLLQDLKDVVQYSELPASPYGWQPGPVYPFSHPLYILFSSGTTGKPKGIVHGAGNTLLEHKKEHILHSDIRPGDRFFYQTSTSWMMWNWLVSGLATGASLVLYDGDAFCEQGTILWRLAAEEKVSQFGTAAAYLGEVRKRSITPSSVGDLSHLRAIFSTGSALAPELFDFVSDSIKPLWLQSISGGTDIVGCFGLGCPIKPVVRGEVQCKSLGYDVQVFNEAGNSVVGEQGELVCAQPAPSMPIYFLDDSDGESYRSAYFADFPGVWRHGDFVRETSEGGLIFGGRSDATLKPGGVRVATTDIYAVLERVPEVRQALAVGFTPPQATSEKIVLFVVLALGSQLTESLIEKIKGELRKSNTFYVPAMILQAPDVPRTPNNKLAELTVKRILHGQDPGNTAALANPESIDYFVTVASSKLLSEM